MINYEWWPKHVLNYSMFFRYLREARKVSIFSLFFSLKPCVYRLILHTVDISTFKHKTGFSIIKIFDIVWTEIGSEVTFYVRQTKKTELEESILNMYICQGSIRRQIGPKLTCFVDQKYRILTKIVHF